MWNNNGVKRPFAATVWREGNWYVSIQLRVDVVPISADKRVTGNPSIEISR